MSDTKEIERRVEDGSDETPVKIAKAICDMPDVKVLSVDGCNLKVDMRRKYFIQIKACEQLVCGRIMPRSSNADYEDIFNEASKMSNSLLYYAYDKKECLIITGIGHNTYSIKIELI